MKNIGWEERRILHCYLQEPSIQMHWSKARTWIPVVYFNTQYYSRDSLLQSGRSWWGWQDTLKTSLRCSQRQLHTSLYDVLTWHFHLQKNECYSVDHMFLKGLQAQSLNQCNISENTRHNLYNLSEPYSVKWKREDPKGSCNATFNS
jgi:hypothetical protein